MRKKLSGIKFETKNLTTGNEWAVSFTDLLTVLLCFFVLYFNTDKPVVQKGLSSYFDQIKVSGTPISEANGGKADASSTKSEGKAMTASSEDQVVQEFKQIKEVTGAEIVKENQFLIIKFRSVSFFDVAKIGLNPLGSESIKEVATFLAKIQDKFVINIIAFTDPSPVRANNKRRWKSNDELSVLRAIHVSDVLSELGINKENMYVTGVVAQSLAYRNLNGNYSKDLVLGKDLDRFRNIALKLEPK
jgi:chemotaxis protein MotB